MGHKRKHIWFLIFCCFILLLSTIKTKNVYCKTIKTPNSKPYGLHQPIDILTSPFLFRQNIFPQVDKEILEIAQEFHKKSNILFDEGKYKEVITLANKIIEQQKKVLGEDNTIIAKSFSILGKAYVNTGNYEEAERLLLKALAIQQRLLGETHIDIAETLNGLGLIYSERGDFTKSEELFLKALKMCKQTFGEESESVAQTLDNLGLAYFNEEQFEQAEISYTNALKIRNKLLGEKSLASSESLDNLGTLYYRTGKFAKSEEFNLKALEIRKNLLGEENLKTLNSMNNLAVLYLGKGKYSQAEPILVKVLELNEKLLAEDNADLPDLLSNLAGLYSVTGEYNKAEKLYEKALEINKKILGDENLSSAHLFTQLGILNTKKGNYNLSEIFLTKGLEIRKKLLGENSPLAANSLNYLASLYSLKGDTDKIENIYLKVIEINKKNLGEEHNDTVNPQVNLAAFYGNTRNFVKAEQYYFNVLNIYKKTLGENHIFTANVLNLLGTLYIEKNDYKLAEEYLVKAAEIRKKILGENNVTYAISLDSLAILAEEKKELEKSKQLLQKVLEIRLTNLGENHSLTADTLQNLAELSYKMQDYANALKYSEQVNEAREKSLSKSLSVGSERRKRAYLRKYDLELNVALSLHLNAIPDNLFASKLALEQILRRKGRATEATNQNIETLRQRAKAEDLVLLDKLSEKKTLFSNISILGAGRQDPEEYKQKLKSLEEEIETLEQTISLNSAEFRSQNQVVSLENVRKSLDEKSLLIEFISYRPVDIEKNRFQEKHYAVYILDSQGKIGWVELGEARPIEELIDSLRAKLRDKHSSLDKELKPISRKLDALIMQPIRKLIEKNKRLLIATDDKLNLIPFATLVDEKGKFLVENYKVSYLTSGRDLLRLNIKTENSSAPVIIGNPDFGPISKLNSLNEDSIFTKFAFKPLKETELEAKAIKALFPEAKLFLHKNASSESLEQVNSPKVLHIATHGFFLADQNISTENRSLSRKVEILGSEDFIDPKKNNLKDPLLRSGLALAGANIKSSEEVGIFTALKATSLNLWGTKLVVLSACDTGLGEVRGNEGIYGLRRALILAGSETQLISLWSVSDKATRDLMIGYYKELRKGEGRADSLRNIQLEMLKSKIYKHPFYWAGFISSGEWANLEGKR
jgi:CHAT domain-containing protein/Tfp pilus assembly protein PilF